MTLKNFEVEYRLPYEHVVVVGVRSTSPDEAQSIVSRAFDDGSIWDNTANMPLLRDDYEEVDNGGVLEFKATETHSFKVDGSVKVVSHLQLAETAIALLRKLEQGTLSDSDRHAIRGLLAAADTWDKTDAGTILASSEMLPDINAGIDEVFTGFVKADGFGRVQVDFKCPKGASSEEQNLAFLDALEQIAEVGYFALGEQPA